MIPPSLTIKPLDQLINFLFPNMHAYASEPLSITDSTILTPKNLVVDNLNAALITTFPGIEKTYLSFDETEDKNQEGLYIDFLNSITPTGMPPHRLFLKENSPIIMLQNINHSKGLSNGIRLICRHFTLNIIVAKISVGEKQGTSVFIPRIPLQPNDPHLYLVQFTRKQFSVRLCFAMTINKTQGQTLNRVGIHLPEPIFSHR